MGYEVTTRLLKTYRWMQPVHDRYESMSRMTAFARRWFCRRSTHQGKYLCLIIMLLRIEVVVFIWSKYHRGIYIYIGRKIELNLLIPKVGCCYHAHPHLIRRSNWQIMFGGMLFIGGTETQTTVFPRSPFDLWSPFYGIRKYPPHQLVCWSRTLLFERETCSSSWSGKQDEEIRQQLAIVEVPVLSIPYLEGLPRVLHCIECIHSARQIQQSIKIILL